MPKKITKNKKKAAPKKKVVQKKVAVRKKTSNHKKAVVSKKITDQEKIRILKFYVIVLVIFSVIISIAFATLLWLDLSYGGQVAKNVGVPVTPVIVRSATGVSAIKNIGEPVRIMIPSINLDSTIEKVGLKSDGSMDVPKTPLNTGWYALGPRPGEIGSAVIDGHVDWWYGAPAVFPNLYKVKPGDKIVVQDEFGVVVSFVVRRTQNFGANSDATTVFTSNDGRAHLNLITCAGVWDYNSNQYSSRLVVFADKE